MRLVLPLSALFVAASVAAAAAGPCGPGKKRHCLRATADTVIDFTAVPDIGKQIVNAEPAPPPVKPATHTPEAKPYTGPTVGLAPLKQAPTVGYKWSLE